MARSLSQANRLVALVAESLSQIPVHWRGYAVASDVSGRVGLRDIARRSGMVRSLEEKPVTRDASEARSAWGPDPVTGYYRPINHAVEIDPVELRQMLLNHKPRSSH
ncbi:late embryogenesis abundant protein Lea5-like [Gastrolobium bilobum]|uniref:late embryogenesis abundant protein Lea5-like n=1 Tax=Gastrolobium bilobum TaxID=150636 RepID=UPI002AB0A2D1|nr:late embryogenesis abundant protein Lea5-like [Gastrolobium bilobum]